MAKTLALSELRRVAERTRIVKVPASQLAAGRNDVGGSRFSDKTVGRPNGKPGAALVEVVERVPWRVWYVAASNGDMILGEECVTLAVYTAPHPPEGGESCGSETPPSGGRGAGAFPSRLVQFTASGQTRRLRDCCILRANDFQLRVL